MRVRFTAIHLVGGIRHEHIANLKAVDATTGAPYQDTRANWVAWMEQKGNSSFVQDNYGNRAEVGVRSNGNTKWLQTYADKVWTDNLLALPRY
ncbi:MAG TPA: DUF3892 domain-containing protein [Candidatus Baltobacteraceae bacterium]|nr:DUF3892 domain-containing protein [Candidatus Baltobacteraceae bacterium]